MIKKGEGNGTKMGDGGGAVGEEDGKRRRKKRGRSKEEGDRGGNRVGVLSEGGRNRVSFIVSLVACKIMQVG